MSPQQDPISPFLAQPPSLVEVWLPLWIPDKRRTFDVHGDDPCFIHSYLVTQARSFYIACNLIRMARCPV